MAHQPDGMANMAAERKHMREMRQLDRQMENRTFWELAALDANGDEIYRTERFDTESEARQEADLLNSGGIPSQLDENIVRFEAVKQE